jgi:hypothetical protein
MTYPVHTSHLSQVLGVLPIRRLKAVKKYLARGHAEHREVDDILRILCAHKIVAPSITMQRSREKAGFSYERGDQTSCLAVDEGRI